MPCRKKIVTNRNAKTSSKRCLQCGEKITIEEFCQSCSLERIEFVRRITAFFASNDISTRVVKICAVMNEYDKLHGIHVFNREQRYTKKADVFRKDGFNESYYVSIGEGKRA